MNTAPVLPLTTHDPDELLACYRGRAVSAREFVAQAAELAARLPDATYAVNLCEDRYHFMLAFAALLIRGQVSLLPPNRAAQVVEEVAAQFPDSYCLIDSPVDGVRLPQVTVVPGEGGASDVVPQIPAQALAAILFTSGSTGTPRPHRKYWGDLVAGTARGRRRLGLDNLPGAVLVATVPPQHMFGLEFTVLAPMLGRVAAHGGRPFYPEDIRVTLAAVTAPRVLVTTPVHLRACVAAGLHWPEVNFILSATAPLSAQLAAAAEQAFGCPVYEVYGCTETGAIARRRTVAGATWQLFDGVSLQCVQGRCEVRADFLRESTLLNDMITLQGDGFTLQGRDGDMINIAGKRASLGDLTHRLLDIPGVIDAAVVLLDEHSERGGRICALVVAPERTEQEILDAMRHGVDAVFLPRPLYRVARLPRSEAGKLPRSQLLAMIEQLRSGDGIQ